MNSSSSRRRVVFIGIDSASPVLLEQWMDDGTLPHLAKLRRRSAYSRLDSTADWLVSSVWPSFATGLPPNDTGVYHYLQWRSDEMRIARLEPKWMAGEPFWRDLDRKGLRIACIDIPYTYAPQHFNGIEMSGWATHDLVFPPFTQPPQLHKWIVENFGRSAHRGSEAMHAEMYEPLPLGEHLHLAEQLIATAKRASQLSIALYQREKWDLFITVFGAAHRAGHLMFGPGSLSGDVTPDDAKQLEDALHSVYIACDEAVGQVLEKLDDETIVMVGSLHGMGPNHSRTDILPTMLARVLAGDTQAVTGQDKIGLLKRLRKMVPARWRNTIKSRLPVALQDRLSMLWRVGKVDWSTTQAVSVTADVSGYIRINLKGREAQGTVEPGEEYEALCRIIEEGLPTFADTETGEPVVQQVVRREAIFPEGERLAWLPDLIVKWSDSPCYKHRKVVSPRFGEIDWPTPGKNPNGRSGNHRPHGFLFAAGPGINGDALAGGAHLLDLPPTFYHLLGEQVPPHMRGRALPIGD